MRKTILFIMVSIMAFSLVACGDDEKKVNEKETTVEKETTTKNDVNDETKEDETEESSEEETENNKTSFSITSKKGVVNVDYDVTWTKEVKSKSVFVYDNYDYVLGGCSDNQIFSDTPFTGKLEDAFDYTINAEFLETMSGAVALHLDDEHEIEIISKENVKVGEFDAIKYVCNLYSNSGNEMYFCGYSFIALEAPHTVFGAVISKEPTDDMITKVNEYLDEMIKSVWAFEL